MKAALLFSALLFLLLFGGTAVVTVRYHKNTDWFVKAFSKMQPVSVRYGRSHGKQTKHFARIQVG